MKKIIYLEQPEDPEERISLVPNKINVFLGSQGILKMPRPSEKNAWLKILFMDVGKFYIEGNGKKIKLGIYEDFWVGTQPGLGPYDTQPEFLWVEKRDLWVCLTQGSLEYPKRAPQEELKQPESIKEDTPIPEQITLQN